MTNSYLLYTTKSLCKQDETFTVSLYLTVTVYFSKFLLSPLITNKLKL